MHSLIKVELLPLTRELAKEFSAMKKMPGERPLKAARIKFFEDHIKNGTFGEPSWSLGICRRTQEKYRLDGQHTSTTLASLPPDAFPVERHVAITTYEFDDVTSDGAALFDKFDNPRSARTNDDMMGFYRAEYDDMMDIENGLCVHIASGIAEFELSRKDGRVLPPRQRGLYFEGAEYRLFANWANDLVMDNAIVNDWLFGKAGVVAEMFADWTTDKSVATEFWSYVLKESHPDRDHITRELAEDFKKWRQRPERRPPSVYRKYATKAWTRYRKEAELYHMRKLPLESAAGQSASA